ncbi:MAG: hypothetical protein QM802_20220 [Agriterribacter sp.]
MAPLQIKQVTNAAWKGSVALGVHTLIMFTGTKDPYVSPIPSDSLCKAGTTTLTQDVTAADAMLYIEAPDFFRNRFEYTYLKNRQRIDRLSGSI